MRTRSTITTWITRVIVDVALCVHTRMSEFEMDHARHRRRRTVCPHPYVRILHRPRVASRIASARVDARSDAMRAMRCVRARFAAIRDAREPARRPPARRPTHMRPRGDRIARSRCRPRDGFEATDDGRRRRDDGRRVAARTRFEDSTSRARAALKRGRRDARARRRATEEGSRARGARGRARDDEGRRGEEK